MGNAWLHLTRKKNTIRHDKLNIFCLIKISLRNYKRQQTRLCSPDDALIQKALFKDRERKKIRPKK
jgi:hypothetical protein